MRSNKHNKKNNSTKTIKQKKIMSDRKKRFNDKRNKVIIFAYIVFIIYVIFTALKWRSLVLPMMKCENSTIVDSSGNVLEIVGSERKKSNVKLSQIPDNLKNAYIDIEDERFYSHKGVDAKRTIAAIGSYIIHFGKSSFGGSTITQQLVKNLTGDDETKITRKVEEWVRANELELFCSKEEILEAYFNIIYVAPNTYGVNAGAIYYFDKNVEDLDLAECAFLAGINNSPNSYNPFSDKDNSEKIKSRSKAVLKKMLELNHISKEEHEQAVQEIEEGLKFKNGNIQTNSDGVYSYHADSVISEVIEDVTKNNWIDKKFAKNYVYMAGLKIYSTENVDIQNKLEEEYEKNKYVITSDSTGNKTQSAMVIIDHTNGQVLGCVGGLGEKTTSRGFNRATQAYRQTGSASKPLAVLVPGISEKIFTSATMYVDEPTKFNDGTVDGYAPTNNDDYIGEITVRRAVESSQNIPFVKMMEQITPKKSIKYLKNMGITSLQDEDESLMLALGGLKKGITPLEMAGAYATIANDGTYIEPTFYTRAEGDNGKVVLKTKQRKKKVFSAEVAYIIKQLLKQPVEGSNGTAKSCKIEGMDVSAKTGTTNDNYDKWLCGFTTYYTAVTWYGYDIGETIGYKGKSPAVVLWSTVMKNIHSGLPKTEFKQNSNVKKATICAKTGLTATSNCSDTYTEYFLSGTVPNQCTSCTGSSSKKSTKNTSNDENKGNVVNTTETQKNNADTSTNTESKTKNENKTTETTNTMVEENNKNNSNSVNITNVPSTENKTNKNPSNSDETQNQDTKKKDNSDNNGNSSNSGNSNGLHEEDDDDYDDGP